jgi:hypothetical protein
MSSLERHDSNLERMEKFLGLRTNHLPASQQFMSVLTKKKITHPSIPDP